MLNVTDLRGRETSVRELRAILPRAGTDVGSAAEQVAPIVDDVRSRGAEAALEYGERFDGVRPEAVRVSADAMRAALDGLDADVRAALETSIRRIRQVHAEQKPATRKTELATGAVVTEVFRPVRRVGLYVPGGKAVYPSSVLMNVIPAQEAGVESMVVCTPPQADFDGQPHPTILAACALLGIDEVWAVGGAQAVALMAYGDDDLEPVDMITGPGNVFVAASKRLVNGVVGIDAEAGPSEIAIIADDTADPVYLAYDLISQAEHDEQAASILITDSPELAGLVDKEIASRYGITLNADRVRDALEGPQSGILIVDDIQAAVRVTNVYAPEHLEIHTANAQAVAREINNAGAIFVGPYSPVPLGDYSAGSNHVLPTSGTARFAAGLSTHTFLKPMNIVEYSAEALEEVADAVITLADEEGLPAHGEAIKARRG
ncbi:MULTISPECIES: histidinol dehydrogenase [Corynebacterium]|uniref:histidinol dehydrogenase n=1 Tax=Corynebacterium TaxID=1716 RepID=UPI0008A17C48|nr:MULTISPECIES: histidinol dehydrogenase [Corynebacterium]MDK8241090.1 histidinol dehydrogenase [Corynebacterium coyleae]OFL93487.1 histidinol dehydrogenase [Corynebacterium sp. HMSC055D05]OFU57892.1 histidinol dehydrogenase [Corynebacterium sp. HMSC11D10]